MGLATAALAATPTTNHLQLKVRQVTILSQKVLMGIDLFWCEKVIVLHAECGDAITTTFPLKVDRG